MKLIVGLGNPGKEYDNTRHNVGFMCIDTFLDSLNVNIDSGKEKFQGIYYKLNYMGEDFLIIKPTTYMNLSGNAVKEIMNFYKISIDDVIVVHDDVDLPVGYIRIRENGASGGHNGIKSIIQCLGSENFKRIRVGIDKGEDMIKHVLTKFKGEESDLIYEACVKVSKALRDYLTMPFNKMMSLNNVRKK